MAEHGATDVLIAAELDISITTYYVWRSKHADFRDALKQGKDVADDAVESALYRRAMGYSHDSVKIMTVAGPKGSGASIEEVPFTEHYPPDPTSMIFWLKNRRPDKWREKQADREDDNKSTVVIRDETT